MSMTAVTVEISGEDDTKSGLPPAAESVSRLRQFAGLLRHSWVMGDGT
jgi:hypothetical protein